MSRGTKTKSKRKFAIHQIPTLEALEQRKLLTAVGTISQDVNGVVDIVGTPSSDIISAEVDPMNASDDIFCVITPGVGTVTAEFPASSITGVSVETDPVGMSPIGPDDDFVNFSGFTFNGTLGVQGGWGNDTIEGQQGGNLLFGGYGNDLIYGGRGDDTISGQGGMDTLHGGPGNDIVSGGVNNDLLFGGAGNDILGGNAGEDTLRTGPGTDSLYGGPGDDLILGTSTGDDFLQGNEGNDTIFGGSGQSMLVGNQGDNFLAAHNEGYLTFVGGPTLPANTGQSLLFGGTGDDTLSSHGGTDQLTGDVGVNYFSVGSNAIIEDPTAGTNTISTNDTYTGTPAQDFTITLTIQVDIGGTMFTAIIPNGAGSDPSGTSVAEAIDGNGTIQFSTTDGSRQFTLGDFFNQWGLPFNSAGIGQYSIQGGGHTMTMTVNGSPSTQFDAQPVSGGEAIVITYTD